jgi:hypothetical protein
VTVPEAKTPAYVPPDFVRGRPLATEQKINQAFAALFRPDNQAAALVLGYLQMQFLHTILGPGDSDTALRHREGQRDLVRIIQQRIDHGQRQLPAAPSGPDASRTDGAAARVE